MPILNLGIVAHVDAGKTTLTERLLFETGVSTHIGRVDHGDTVTDADAIERQRGITIRSAVVTFTIGDIKVNLIDTPGHSDFVAEVERALAVLDGAVLVVSAVEGVQAQTRVLIRILERLQIPFLIFANKIDRVGATYDETMAAIREALSSDAVALTEPIDLGSRASTVRPRDGAGFLDDLVERIAEHDDQVLRQYVDGAQPFTEPQALAALARLTSSGSLHPVYFGSALTGIGVADVIGGVSRYLPPRRAPVDEPLHASVFKIERDPAGHKVAFARLHSGTLTARDHVVYHHRSTAGVLAKREVMAGEAGLAVQGHSPARGSQVRQAAREYREVSDEWSDLVLIFIDHCARWGASGQHASRSVTSTSGVSRKGRLQRHRRRRLPAGQRRVQLQRLGLHGLIQPVQSTVDCAPSFRFVSPLTGSG